MNAYNGWESYFNSWIVNDESNINLKKIAFEKFKKCIVDITPNGNDIIFFYSYHRMHEVNLYLNLKEIGKIHNKNYAERIIYLIVDFSEYIIEKNEKIKDKFNPFFKYIKSNIKYNFYTVAKNEYLCHPQWLEYIKEWCFDNKIDNGGKLKYLFDYLEKKNVRYIVVDDFYDRSDRLVDFEEYLYGIFSDKSSVKRVFKKISIFLKWVFDLRYDENDVSFENPIYINNYQNFNWILNKGKKWCDWVNLGEKWYLEFSNELVSLSTRKTVINQFLIFLSRFDDLKFYQVTTFFNSNLEFHVYESFLKESVGAESTLALYKKSIFYFLEWVESKYKKNNLNNPFKLEVVKQNRVLSLDNFCCLYGVEWEEWIYLIKKYDKTENEKVFLSFLSFIKRENKEYFNIIFFLNSFNNFDGYQSYIIEYYSCRVYVKHKNIVNKFLNEIIRSEFNNLSNPFSRKNLINFSEKYFFKNKEFWMEWLWLADEWLLNEISYKQANRYCIAIKHFIEIYLSNLDSGNNVELFFLRNVSQNFPDKELKNILSCNFDSKVCERYFRVIQAFTTWILITKFRDLWERGVINPLGIYLPSLRISKKYDEDFLILVNYYSNRWVLWQSYASEWVKLEGKNNLQYINSLYIFFECYLIKYPDISNPKEFFLNNFEGSRPSNNYLIDCILLHHDLKNNTIELHIRNISRFLNWILFSKYNDLFKSDVRCSIELKRKITGKTRSIDFNWFVNEYGEKWNSWCSLIKEWLLSIDRGLSAKNRSMNAFLEHYLVKLDESIADIDVFFKGVDSQWNPSNENLEQSLDDSLNVDDMSALINPIVEFIDWLILKKYSSKNDFGHLIPSICNPFKKIKDTRSKLSESVYQALPYKYIHKLKSILSSNISRGNFKNWAWAISITPFSKNSAFWFEVPYSLIDQDDPDCVWIVYENTYYMWSPVAAIALWVKLNLPLRTFQVRMLDSGEADEFRYIENDWIKNESPLALNKRKNGIFRRTYDPEIQKYVTALYINTNKTADLYKTNLERGYVIPWNNIDVLYWLEKLRNWQEKYNPIDNLTDCSKFEVKHINRIVSEKELKRLGKISFLFRNPINNQYDKDKPIAEYAINRLWFLLLRELEDSFDRSNGDNNILKFVKRNTSRGTFFPLHSLRVSLLTIYHQYSGLPLEFVSKFLAGHSSIVMTLHYIKNSFSRTNEILNQVYKDAQENGDRDERFFLKDAEISLIEKQTAYQDIRTIRYVLKKRNPVAWEIKHHGICLAGGNTVNKNNDKNLIGCWDGGESILNQETGKVIGHESVPHHYENCIRCRWFITDIRFLPALIAHFNLLSYKSHLVAKSVRKLSNKVSLIEQENFIFENKGLPIQNVKLLENLYSQQSSEMQELDDLASDAFATLYIIRKIIDIERSNSEDNSGNIIAIGSKNDISVALEENHNEIFQLLNLCCSSAIYPEIRNQISRTPAIERTTALLSKLLSDEEFNALGLDDEEQLIAINGLINNFKKNNAISRKENTSMIREFLISLQLSNESKEIYRLEMLDE